MGIRKWIGVVVVSAVLVAGNRLTGDKGQMLPASLLKPGEMVFSDQFDRIETGERFRVLKGKWSIREQELHGAEIKADNHAAVALFGQPFRDGLLRFSFRMQGAKGFHLSLNHSTGHLFRVVVSDREVVLRTDRDKKKQGSVSEILARSSEGVLPGEWFTMQLETVGESVLVRIDNGITLSGRASVLKCEKTGYRFVVQGQSVYFDDIQIFAASAERTTPVPAR